MQHPHYQTPRQRQVEEAYFKGARLAVRHNFFGGLIGRTIATRQLRETGMFEAEIMEALSR